MSKLYIQKDVDGIKDLCVVEPFFFQNPEGYLTETYNYKEFFKEGLKQIFVQDNEVWSRQGVIRGMHVNVKHPQGKLIRVISGKIFDVVVDLRMESPTYKKWFGIELSKNNKKQLYIPERMGHGYLALMDSVVLFKVTTHYIPNDEIAFSWKSKEMGIQWPVEGLNIIQNRTDQCSRDLSEIQF